MPSANGKPKAILYCRVSTQEQAEHGYSLRQQIERLREYAAAEGYEVLEEVTDPGQSGAYLQRPGLDRVRDRVEDAAVSVVLAQDADRITRDPAHRAFLDEELERRGTRLVALDDWGDDTHEGELLRYLKGWVSKGERMKTTERTRRGKLRKAKEGKVIAIHTPNYGFRYNDSRDGYEVEEESMRVVCRIFEMIGGEHRTLYAVKRTLEREGVPTPNGGKFWTAKVIRQYILDDVYRPHLVGEIMGMVDAGQMAPSVAAALDKDRSYGVWWYNRRHCTQEQTAISGGNGQRAYKKRSTYTYRPQTEWVAVPVPGSGIPRETAEAAREAVRDNRAPSAAGHRVWELSGGILHCGRCGHNMMIHSTTAPRANGRLFYYRCRKRNRDGAQACSHGKCHRAEEMESRVWDLVSGLLKDPERLRGGLEAMIEAERAGLRSNPDQEFEAWTAKLAEAEDERRGYLRLAAKGRITDEELDEALTELEDTRRTAEREMAALTSRKETLEQLERDKDALLEHYAQTTPAALDALTSEERHQVHKMLRLRVAAYTDGSLEVSGALRECFVPENQDQRLAPAHYQVYLSAASAVVALDDLVSVAEEVIQRDPLAPVSGPLSTQLRRS